MGVLNDDDPSAVQWVDNDDGTTRMVRNYTAKEYAATYAEGEPCNAIPDDVMRAAERRADELVSE